MWDGLLVLFLLCIVMAASSFLVGMLPLYFSLSSRQLRLTSALGTGILVGVALIIIIPEGVETLYNASGSVSNIGARSIPLHTRTSGSLGEIPALSRASIRRRDDLTAIPANTGFDYDVEQLGTYDDSYLEDATAAQAQELENERQQKDEHGITYSDHTQDGSAGSTHSADPHMWVGLSLISGFILMYLIDTVPRNTASRPERFQISLNNLNFNNRQSSMPADSDNLEPQISPAATSSQPSNTSRPSSTTTGLVIHACADGIALGASSTTTSRLTFIIFLALIIHKAPASFGLTSVLLKQGLSKRMARAHLIVFSLAAPVGALVTWAAAHLLGYSSSTSSNSISTEFATGVLLLFSGGTFLYVATHTMQDSSGHEHGAEMQMNGYRGASMSDVYETSNANVVKGSGRSARLTETGLTVVGMLAPLLFQFGHGH